MKTVVCTKYGPPEVLQLADVEKPAPKFNEVLIKIETTSVSVGDTRIRGFRVPLSFRLPARLMLGITKPRHPVLGSVLAGTIESRGKDVTLFNPGDEVVAFTGHNFGAYAEYICMRETGCITKKPGNLSFSEATAIPWGGYTSMHFLEQAAIKPGQRVLVYGASGSLGTAAIQLAKYAGAEVTGVCSTVNLKLVKSLGADRVIDYTTGDVFRNGEMYDVIYDTVGKSPVFKSMKALRKKGILLHAVLMPMYGMFLKIIFKLNGRQLVGGTFTSNAIGLNRLNKLAEEGILRPVIDRTYPLEDIVEAHRYVDAGHKKGNLVITINHSK